MQYLVIPMTGDRVPYLVGAVVAKSLSDANDEAVDMVANNNQITSVGLVPLETIWRAEVPEP